MLGASAQLDLFVAPAPPRWWLGEGEEIRAERLGWERRLLSDLAAGPRTYCYPGFTGAICERLVSKGHASREDAGEMPMPEFWPDTSRGRKEWKARGPHPQFTYTITESGRAILAAQEACQ